MNDAGSCSIETDYPRTSFARYGIGLQACSVVVVHDLDFLSGDDVGSIHQIFIDGDATHIVEVGLRNGYAVYFGF